MGTAPMTAEELKHFIEKLPDPDKIYDSATIDKFTSRKYVMKKATKYYSNPMSKYMRDFKGRRDRAIIVEPTLLTDFFEGKRQLTIEDLIANEAKSHSVKSDGENSHTTKSNVEESVATDETYFLCRTIRPPYIETKEVKITPTGLVANINLVVEDPDGKRTISIRLFDYMRRHMGDIIDEFPVGIVLAVSNPVLMHEYVGSSIGLHYTDEAYAELTSMNQHLSTLIIPSDAMIRQLYPNGLKWNSAIPVEYQRFVLDIQFAHQITTPDGWKKLGIGSRLRKRT